MAQDTSRGTRSRDVRIPVFITAGVTTAGVVLFWFFLVNPWNFVYGGRVASVAVGIIIAGGIVMASLPIQRTTARRIVASAGVSVAIVVSVLLLLLSLWTASSSASGVRSSRVIGLSPDGETRMVLIVKDGYSKNSAAEVKLQSGRKPFHQETTVFYTHTSGAPQRIRFTGPHTIEVVLGGSTRRLHYDPDTQEADTFMPD